ncbi:hypothetical protein QUF91_21410 [Lysinibacillus sp. G4S2]|nr:hypothetical protein [Lysinibacillus sp. G4S2]
MCESEATATNVLCAKAKRQQLYDNSNEGIITGRDNAFVFLFARPESHL